MNIIAPETIGEIHMINNNQAFSYSMPPLIELIENNRVRVSVEVNVDDILHFNARRTITKPFDTNCGLDEQIK